MLVVHSAKFSAEWSASLVLQTDTSGIKASLQGSPSPTFDGVCFEGEAEELLTTDLESQLRALFPDTISLDDVLDELKQFEGIWQTAYPGMKAHCLVNPIFNSHGDLLFELQPHTILQAQSIPGPARPSGANRPRRRWNDGTAANRGVSTFSDLIILCLATLLAPGNQAPLTPRGSVMNDSSSNYGSETVTNNSNFRRSRVR